jgi:predicted CXXCH cytochrome family protein
MSAPASGGPALVSDRRAEVGRRRVAPKAVETSDVTRYRGVLPAVVVAVVVASIAIAVSWAMGAPMGEPRALSRPHRIAGLTCENCHSSGATMAEAVNACTGCHGSHESQRRGHASLARDGTLVCTSCHETHGADNGVAFRPDGTAVRYGHGSEIEVEGGRWWTSLQRDLNVPVLEASRCGVCHDIENAADPVAPCLVQPGGVASELRPAVCFDEHRDVLLATAQGRTAAWEAARRVAEVAPVAKAPPGHDRGLPGLWVGLGLFAGLLTLGGQRLTTRLRTRIKSTVALPQQAVLPASVIRLPQINTNTCIGCHACVDACPYDVLEVHNYVAQVVRPDDCCGLTLCEQRCPNGSLQINDGAPIEDRPHMNDDLQSIDSPGVYLAGDLTGLPLIRNAINQGAHVVRMIAAGLGAHRGGAMLDLVIIGAGPAGMSAALEAKAQGLRYCVLEQGSVAESIRSFPRGKLVFDQPLGLPLIGDLWLQKATKEELLSKWLRIVHNEQLAIYEGHRVLGIDRVAGGPPAGHLCVRHLAPDGQPRAVETRRVLLAFGRRGSPRKLAFEIPDAFASHVHYSLADARSFANTRVLVLGLGDVAMEAAIALANQPGTQVTVSYRGSDFRRGKSRNVAEVKRLAAAGRIRLLLATEVGSIDPGRVTLTSAQGPIEVDCDSVFVMIGTIAPWQFLEACGVKRVTNAPTPELPASPDAVIS